MKKLHVIVISLVVAAKLFALLVHVRNISDNRDHRQTVDNAKVKSGAEYSPDLKEIPKVVTSFDEIKGPMSLQKLSELANPRMSRLTNQHPGACGGQSLIASPVNLENGK